MFYLYEDGMNTFISHTALIFPFHTVSLGPTVVKGNARKVRRIGQDVSVVAGVENVLIKVWIVWRGVERLPLAFGCFPCFPLYRLISFLLHIYPSHLFHIYTITYPS